MTFKWQRFQTKQAYLLFSECWKADGFTPLKLCDFVTGFCTRTTSVGKSVKDLNPLPPSSISSLLCDKTLCCNADNPAIFILLRNSSNLISLVFEKVLVSVVLLNLVFGEAGGKIGLFGIGVCSSDLGGVDDKFRCLNKFSSSA